MSRSEFHGEKRQEVTDNLKTDIPTVNVSINIERPLIQGQETFQTSQTSLPAGQTLPLNQTFQTSQIPQTGQLNQTYQPTYPPRLNENTLRESDIQNDDTRPRHISSDTTNTNVSNEESLKEKAKDVKDNVKEKANDVKEKTNDVKENVKEKTNDVKENIKEKTNDVKEKANDVKENVKEKTNDVKEKANDVKEDIKEKTNDLIENVKEKTNNLTENMKEKTNTLKENVIDKTSTLKENVIDKTSTLKENVIDKTSTLKEGVIEKTNTLKENVIDKTNTLKENVIEKTNTLKDNVIEKTNTLKDNVIEKTNTLKENVAEKTNTLKENVAEKTNTLKENIVEKTNTLKENVIERTNTLKGNVQETTNNLKEKANDVKERVMTTASDTYNKGKEKIEYKINMNSLIKRARYCLEDFVNPKLNIEKQIPIRILNNAFGIVFLIEYKGSFGIGSSMGTGLIIARTSDRRGWTGPCAIGMGGISIGFQAGLQRIEHIIVLRDENVLKTFVSKGQLKLGGDISFAVGPLGRDAQISVNFNDKDYAPIYSYSMSKGLHIGASLDGQAILIRDDCNESYYGKKVSAKDILFGNVNSLINDNEYSLLVKLVDEYTQKQGDLSQDWFTDEEDRQQHEEDWEKSLHTNLGENIPKLERDNKLEKSARHLEIPDTTTNLFKNEKSKDNKSGQRINMDRLLKHARFSLESFMDSKLESEKQIPVSLLNNACGILFLTEIKGGFGIGGSTGTGFIITRKLNENKFSQPCAIGVGGVSFGFQIGGQKTEHILIFRDEAILRTFIRKRELNLGGDVSFSIGPLGRDMNVPLNANDKGYSTIYSYSTANGVYLGATIERQMFQVLDEWNEDYFGKKVTLEEILFDDVKPLSMDQHQSYESLINLIKEYTENKGILQNNDSYWGELDRKEEEYWRLDTTTSNIETSNIETSNIETSNIQEENNMYRLLNRANYVFEQFVNPNLSIEKRIPITILNGARAIIFLTEIKAGLLVGASLGRGFVLARKPGTNAWTGPCAISLGGMSVGWIAGAEKTDHVLVLRESSTLQDLLSKGQLKFGGDLSFAIGPLGRDASVAINVNDKGYAPIYSYSMSKGAYIGASLDGHFISIRDDFNEEYYGSKVSALDIVHGLIKSPKDQEYKSLCNRLDQYINLDLSTNVKDTKDWQNFNDKDIKDVKDTKDWQNFDDKGVKDTKDWQSFDDKGVKDTKDWQSFDDKGIKDTKDWQGLNDRDIKDTKDFKSFDNKGIKDTKDWQGFDDKVVKDTKDWQGFNDRDIKDTKDFKGFDDKGIRDTKDWQSFDDKGIRDTKDWQSFDDKGIKDTKDWQSFDDKGIKDTKDWQGFNDRDIKGFDNKDFKNVDNTNIYDKGDATKIVHEKSDVTRVITDIPKDEDRDKIL